MALSGKRNRVGFWNYEFSREDDVDEEYHSDGFGKVSMQLYFVLPLVYHILLFTLGFVDMRSSWLLWIPKVVHWYFVYLEFLIPYLEARSPILMDFSHLYILHNGSSSLWLCARFWEGLFWTHLKKSSLTTKPCKYIYIYTYMLEFYL